MALPGYYKVNFTDPRKDGFIIEPYQTDGTISPASPIIDSKASRASTSLLLYGRDVPNYGERIAENFVQLLENFAGPGAPQHPIEGQLWFDTGTIYPVYAWSSATTLLFAENLTVPFTKFKDAATVITLAFSPSNASVDNSLQQVDLVVDLVELLPSGATAVTFKSTDGTYIQLPKTVASGFIALSGSLGSARLRVATTSSSGIKWIDVTNVLSTHEEPDVTNRSIGDLWFDPETSQLTIFDGLNFTSVAAKYIPLTGTGIDPVTGDSIHPMRGDIDMGPYKVFSQGTITALDADRYALITREYADGIKSNLQTQVDGVKGDLQELRDIELAAKVSTTGDEITGVLLFGDGQSTSVISGLNSRGLDANNNPIVRPLYTWNPTDYLTAAFEPYNVIDKVYVAKAIRQHLDDASHGGDGFIRAQPDGSGLLPADVAFHSEAAGVSHKLSWYDITRMKEHKVYAQFSGTSSQLVIEAGSESTIDFRHASQLPLADPLFRIGTAGAASFQTIYLLDGQPQPTTDGDQTSLNDDTAAAAKGFVRKYVADSFADNVAADKYVNDVQYYYDLTALSYSMVISQTGNVPPLSVNMYHQHDAKDAPYTYKPLEGYLWAPVDPIVDFIAPIYPTYPNITVNDMLNVLNAYKAPVKDARFVHAPVVGGERQVIDSTTNSFHVSGNITDNLKIGLQLWIHGSKYNDGLYTITAITAGALDSLLNPTTTLTVEEIVPTPGIETVKPTFPAGDPSLVRAVTCYLGDFVEPTNVAGLVTRATMDYELNKASKYQTFSVTADAVNEIRTLPFTYHRGRNKLWVFRNGQKLRVNISVGGDFDEVSSTTIKIATVKVGDQFEVYEI